jgi:hypothetical protein
VSSDRLPGTYERFTPIRVTLACWPLRTNPGHLFGAGPVAAFRREELSDVGARDGCLSGNAAT